MTTNTYDVVKKCSNAAMLFALSFAAEPIRAHHPLTTEDTGTQGKGGFQLELVTERGVEDEDGVEETATEYAAVLSYGVSDSVDVMVGVPYSRVEVEAGGNSTSVSGVGDASLDAKWRFYEKDKLSLAFKGGATFTTGDEDEGLGSEEMSYNLSAVATLEGDPWTLHAQAGWVRNKNDIDERENLFHISAAAVYGYSDSLHLAVDVAATQNPDRASGDHLHTSVVLGAIYSPSQNIALDLGYKHGLVDAETDSTVLAGFTCQF